MVIQNRVGGIIRTTAGYLLNTIILLVALNVVLGVLFYAYDAHDARRANVIFRKYPNIAKQIVKLYPSMSEDDISRLLHETWSRHLVLKSIVGFGEAPFHGKFVNVTEEGFRLGKDQGPWPPVQNDRNFIVFLFGGSTTFGYGVTDAQALGSQLQPLLAQKLERPVSVYNFGQAAFGSTQERLLLEKLVLAGRKPDMAIFVDGLNEFKFTWGDEEFEWTTDMAKGSSPHTGPPTWRSWLSDGIDVLPMTRLVNGVRTRIGPRRKSRDASSNQKYNDDASLLKVIARYYLNTQIAEAEGKQLRIRMLFVWQPVPLYEYDLKYHPFIQNGFGDYAYTKRGYVLMADAVQKKRPDDFLWCADMQKDLHEPLYVDAVHYSPKMTGMFAGCIADGVK
jgi:hypothetical protein